MGTVSDRQGGMVTEREGEGERERGQKGLLYNGAARSQEARPPVVHDFV